MAPGFVRRGRLPQVEPRIDPGFAITGMPAYLVVENQDDFTPATGWSSTWTLAGESGTVTGMTTTDMALRVREYRAVRVTPRAPGLAVEPNLPFGAEPAL